MLLKIFIAYLIGSIPCQGIVQALKKKAVFSTSHSLQNSWLRHFLGEDWTVLIHFLNAIKSALPILCFGPGLLPNQNDTPLSCTTGYILIAIIVIIGCIFPVWTKFQREKSNTAIVSAIIVAVLFPVCAVTHNIHHSAYLQHYLSLGRIFGLSYLCGSFPTGYLIGRINGIDIRQYGSHNIGSTNVRRTLGKPWGIVCFLFDFSKGFLPVYFIGQGQSGALDPAVGGLIAALAAVLGHVFPVWLWFRGGKGVATCLGVALAIAFWPVLIAGIVWLLAFRLTRIVAIASMLAVTALSCSALLLHLCRSNYLSWPEIMIFFLITAGVVGCHHENIHRLIEGKENSFNLPGKNA